MQDAETAWKSTLEKVFKTVSGEGTKDEEYPDTLLSGREGICMQDIKWRDRRVFIPVFPGTNCEYDSTKAFERAGADVDVQGIQKPDCRRHPGFCRISLKNP